MVNWIKEHVFIVGLALVLLCTAIHGMTIGYSPMPWIDEVQIVEIVQGGLVNKTSSWSMCPSSVELAEHHRLSTWSPYYLGGVIQGAGYRSFGHFGPRLFSLLGLVAAFVLCYLWIKTRFGLKWVAVVGALFLFLDPLLTSSVCGARVDIYCIAICFAICYLLALIRTEWTLKRELILVASVGALLVVSEFIWVSAVMLWGLVFAEGIAALCTVRRSTGRVVLWGLAGLSGALVVLSCLVAPLVLQGYDVLANLRDVASGNTNGGWSIVHLKENLGEFLGCIKGTPFLAVLGILGLLCFKKAWIALALFGCWTGYVLGTRIYIHRFVYFLPYFIYGVAFMLAALKPDRIGPAVKVVACLGLAFGLLRSVVVRDGVEALTVKARSFEDLKATMVREVGTGPIRIYSETFQPYYVGRALGWHMFRDPFGIKEDQRLKLLRKCDYVLLESLLTDQTTRAILAQNHFRLDKEFQLEPHLAPWIVKILVRFGRPIGYGPYLLYHKEVE